MSEDDGVVRRPERPDWDSFWARPATDGVDGLLRERPDVVEPGRFELSDEELERDAQGCGEPEGIAGARR